jgi:hypothetical protein
MALSPSTCMALRQLFRHDVMLTIVHVASIGSSLEDCARVSYDHRIRGMVGEVIVAKSVFSWSAMFV